MENLTVEQLKQKKSNILASRDFSEANLQECRDIESQISQIKKIDLLRAVNLKQARLRDMAKQAYECEIVPASVFNNDGSPHTTKVKKYPKIAAIPYLYAKCENDKVIELRINGEKFRMYAQKYEYNKPTEYTRPSTFSEFLELNGILETEFTLDQLNEAEKKNNEINEAFEQAVKTFDTAKSKLNLYSLSDIGLFSQSNAGHIYKYSLKNY